MWEGRGLPRRWDRVISCGQRLAFHRHLQIITGAHSYHCEKSACLCQMPHLTFAVLADILMSSPVTIQNINQLPDEILLSIILLSAPPAGMSSPFEDDPEDARWFPWRYMRISRHWKSLIEFFPILWNHIELGERPSTLGSSLPSNQSQELEAAGLRRCGIHLQRSGMVPLTLRVSASSSHAVMGAVVEQRSRWKDVELETTHESLVSALITTRGKPWSVSLWVSTSQHNPVRVHRYLPVTIPRLKVPSPSHKPRG